jgi:hypothetical protein
VVVRHFPICDVVLFPLRSTLGERDLGLDDFLEERIDAMYFGDVVIQPI